MHVYNTDPDSDLGEVGPRRDLFPRRHIRVSITLEGRLEVLQLLTGEVGPLAALSTTSDTTSGCAASGAARTRQ